MNNEIISAKFIGKALCAFTKDRQRTVATGCMVPLFRTELLAKGIKIDDDPDLQDVQTLQQAAHDGSR